MDNEDQEPLIKNSFQRSDIFLCKIFVFVAGGSGLPSPAPPFLSSSQSGRTTGLFIPVGTQQGVVEEGSFLCVGILDILGPWVLVVNPC